MDPPRRIARCFTMDVLSHDPAFVTRAVLETFPVLANDVEVLRGAVDLAHLLGFPQVRIAVLSDGEGSEGPDWEDELKPKEFRIRMDIRAFPHDVAAFLSWKG